MFHFNEFFCLIKKRQVSLGDIEFKTFQLLMSQSYIIEGQVILIIIVFGLMLCTLMHHVNVIQPRLSTLNLTCK